MKHAVDPDVQPRVLAGYFLLPLLLLYYEWEEQGNVCCVQMSCKRELLKFKMISWKMKDKCSMSFLFCVHLCQNVKDVQNPKILISIRLLILNSSMKVP